MQYSDLIAVEILKIEEQIKKHQQIINNLKKEERDND